MMGERGWQMTLNIFGTLNGIVMITLILLIIIPNF